MISQEKSAANSFWICLDSVCKIVSLGKKIWTLPKIYYHFVYIYNLYHIRYMSRNNYSLQMVLITKWGQIWRTESLEFIFLFTLYSIPYDFWNNESFCWLEGSLLRAIHDFKCIILNHFQKLPYPKSLSESDRYLAMFFFFLLQHITKLLLHNYKWHFHIFYKVI